MLETTTTSSVWPTHLLPSFTPSTSVSLPVYDLTNKKAVIIDPHKRVRPLPPPLAQQLQFDPWRFAHAVKKAECLRRLSHPLSEATALGFLLENDHLFAWSSGNFRLANGATTMLTDFARTSLAGRIAQGCAMLCMETWGYAFTDNFTSFCRACDVKIEARVPDFVFENDVAERVLVESKGGFVAAENRASIKGELHSALDQLEPWGSQFDPAITKKFAIATFLREQKDDAAEPSLISFVDPEGGQSADAKPVPKRRVVIANYAAWLGGMGYREVAQRLVGDRDIARHPTEFAVVESQGHRYAIVPVGYAANRNAGATGMASALVGLPFHPSLLKADLLLRDDADLVVVGLDFVVLKELARRPHPEDDFVGLGLGLDVGFGVSVNLNLDAGDGSSRFRDGSFIGKIPARQLRDSLQFRTLEL